MKEMVHKTKDARVTGYVAGQLAFLVGNSIALPPGPSCTLIIADGQGTRRVTAQHFMPIHLNYTYLRIYVCTIKST